MDAVQLTKLQAQVEALLNLAIGAHERFLFLRPMMVSRELQDRFTSEDEISNDAIIFHDWANSSMDIMEIQQTFR